MSVLSSLRLDVILITCTAVAAAAVDFSVVAVSLDPLPPLSLHSDYVLPGESSVMDGPNVSPHPGKGLLTANNGGSSSFTSMDSGTTTLISRMPRYPIKHNAPVHSYNKCNRYQVP